MSRRTVALLAALALAAFVTASLVARGGGRSSGTAPINVALLERSPTAADALPARVLLSPVGRSIDPQSSRRIGRFGADTWYAVRAAHHAICLVAVGEQGDGGGCSPEAELEKGAVMEVRATRGRAPVLLGLVPDGYQEVRQGGRRIATVRRNAFFLRVGQSSSAVLHGDSAPDKRIILAGP